MEKEKLNKQQITALVIGVLTMVILVSSATYAYFKVSVGNTATSTTITGDIGGDTIGTVTLSGGGSELYLGVSADDMSESKKGTTYYSSTTEGSRETNINNAGKTTYTATLSGDDTNEIMYACDYEFTVTSIGTALGKEHTSDISVVFEGDIKKTIPLSASETVSGTWFGFKNSNKDRSFNAYLQLSNTDSEQNSLAGTNLSVEIKNTKWNCYLSENDELVGDAYALLFSDQDFDNYGSTWYNSELIFVRSETPILAGDSYNDREITEVYTGFESDVYTSSSYVPWHGKLFYSILFEDEIRPISTAYWFSGVGKGIGEDCYDYIDSFNLTNLNISLVTDMSYMFYGAYFETLEDISSWDVSNVTDMSYMFSAAGHYLTHNGGTMQLEISNWDVSNVTNMSGMFNNWLLKSIGELTNWNVSNVTDMSSMFWRSSLTSIGDISQWNTSKVTDMSNMFFGSSLTSIGDISQWNTSKVTNMSNMFKETIFTTIGNLSGWDTANVTNMSGMFSTLRNLTTVGNLSNWNTSKVTDMSYMFSGPDYEDHGPFNIVGVTSWDVSNVTNMEGMFMYNHLNLNLSGWETDNVTNMALMFYNSYGEIGDISGWNVSGVTNMQDMFAAGNITPPSWYVDTGEW